MFLKIIAISVWVSSWARQRLSLTGLHGLGEEELALPKPESLNLYGEARRGDPLWLKARIILMGVSTARQGAHFSEFREAGMISGKILAY
jgi:hypothetical protein